MVYFKETWWKTLAETLVIKFREIAGVCNFALMVGSRSKQHK